MYVRVGCFLYTYSTCWLSPLTSLLQSWQLLVSICCLLTRLAADTSMMATTSLAVRDGLGQSRLAPAAAQSSHGHTPPVQRWPLKKQRQKLFQLVKNFSKIESGNGEKITSEKCIL